MRTVGPNQASGWSGMYKSICPLCGWTDTHAFFNQVIVAVEDVVTKSLTVPHSGHAFTCESSPAVDPNEVSGLRREGALDHPLH